MILLFNKPFNVLCQFTDDQNRATLADYIKQKNIYAAGRLDRDSEGLLILTDDGKLQHKITDPKNKMEKTYWAQVEGEASKKEITQLQKGRNSKRRARPNLPKQKLFLNLKIYGIEIHQLENEKIFRLHGYN